jgi:hypothetical protein
MVPLKLSPLFRVTEEPSLQLPIEPSEKRYDAMELAPVMEVVALNAPPGHRNE